MLNIKNFDDIKDEGLRTLLAELRPVHISRFPIDVVVGGDGHQIKFMDSRFPNDHFRFKNGGASEAQVAVLWLDGYDKDNKRVYKIYSRLIQNNRYSTYNDDYRTRSTNDLRKMAKYLKECIKPFTAMEIAVNTLQIANGRFSDWQETPRNEWYNVLRTLGNHEFMELFTQLKAQGVAPVNQKVVAIYEKGLPAEEIYQDLHR